MVGQLRFAVPRSPLLAWLAAIGRGGGQWRPASSRCPCSLPRSPATVSVACECTIGGAATAFSAVSSGLRRPQGGRKDATYGPCGQRWSKALQPSRPGRRGRGRGEVIHVWRSSAEVHASACTPVQMLDWWCCCRILFSHFPELASTRGWSQGCRFWVLRSTVERCRGEGDTLRAPIFHGFSSLSSSRTLRCAGLIPVQPDGRPGKNSPANVTHG